MKFENIVWKLPKCSCLVDAFWHYTATKIMPPPPNLPPIPLRPQQPARAPHPSHTYDPHRVQPLPPGYPYIARPQGLGYPPGLHSNPPPGHPTHSRLHHTMPGCPHEPPRATQTLSLETLTQTIMTAISGVLESHQATMLSKHESIETTLQQEISKRLDSNFADVDQLLGRLNDVQQRAIQAVADRVLELEKVVRGKRTPDSYGNSMSIMDKLDSLSYTLDDLLERAQDPQANLGISSLTICIHRLGLFLHFQTQLCDTKQPPTPFQKFYVKKEAQAPCQRCRVTGAHLKPRLPYFQNHLYKMTLQVQGQHHSPALSMHSRRGRFLVLWKRRIHQAQHYIHCRP